ncbi:TRAP transporter substrate-binding protein [Thioclava sp. GXIMD4215]|uniref:TRAP transporter substrate-binding protein n=1 Tax=Thioclava sp. GXIMD4215 TaxID=3131928 RepID=UPI00311AE095
MFRSLALAAIALSIPLAVCAQPFRLGLITPPTHQWTKTAQEISQEIAQGTEGRLQIMVMPSGQLGNEARILQQVQTGAVDFAFLTGGEFANRDPDYGVFYAPYLVSNTQEAAQILQGGVAHTLLDRLDGFGLKGLGWGMAGMRQIVMSGPIETRDDLRGKRIRTVPLAPEMAFWSELGAAPTPMPLPALYDAFANGQIDGMQIDHESTWTAGYWRNAKVVLNSNHMIFPMLAVASQRSWAKISPEDQTRITAIMERELAQMNTAYARIDADNLAELRQAGVDVRNVDRDWFGAAVDRWYAAWRQKAPLLTVLEQEINE